MANALRSIRTIKESMQHTVLRCYCAQQYRTFRTSATVRCPNTEFVDQNALNTEREKTFEELLQSSPLMKIRRPQGKIVTGNITNVCNDDLYVDFGGKFYTVVKRPAVNSEQYQVGKSVRIMLKKLEMTGHFLGQSKHITLLEADATLLGLNYKQSYKG